MYKTFENKVIDLFKEHNKQVAKIIVEPYGNNHKYTIIFKQLINYKDMV